MQAPILHPHIPSRPQPKFQDYINAAVITLGCTLFMMTGSVKSKRASADSSTFGILLMLGYLGFDGFTSTFQDKLFKVRPGKRGGGQEHSIGVCQRERQREKGERWRKRESVWGLSVGGRRSDHVWEGSV